MNIVGVALVTHSPKQCVINFKNRFRETQEKMYVYLYIYIFYRRRFININDCKRVLEALSAQVTRANGILSE